MERQGEVKGGEASGREKNHVCPYHLIRMNKSHSDSGDISEMIWKVEQKKRGVERVGKPGVVGNAGSFHFGVLCRPCQAASKLPPQN